MQSSSGSPCTSSRGTPATPWPFRWRAPPPRTSSPPQPATSAATSASTSAPAGGTLFLASFIDSRSPWALDPSDAHLTSTPLPSASEPQSPVRGISTAAKGGLNPGLGQGTGAGTGAGQGGCSCSYCGRRAWSNWQGGSGGALWRTGGASWGAFRGRP